MTMPRLRFVVRVLLVVVWLPLGRSSLAAQSMIELGIDHQPRDCFLEGSFPVVDAAVAASDRLKSVKVYFRAEQHPDFYWVEMRAFEDGYVGVLPKPSPDTKRILYYIEAVDLAFHGVRDASHDPEIRPRCRTRNGAYVPGDDPSIVVGATNASGPSLPPGFQAAGIAGFMSAAGISSALGGGVGAGSAVIIGASVAGAAGAAAVAVTGGDEAPPRRPDTGPRSTTTTPAGRTTTIPAGGTTTSVPPEVTTTVSSGTSSVPPTSVPGSSLDACFAYVSKLAPCVHVWSAACSSGPIVNYEWLVDTTGELPAGPRSFSSPLPALVVEWNTVGGCLAAPSIAIRLTVRDVGGATDQTTLSGFQIDSRSPEPKTFVQARMRSTLRIGGTDSFARGVLRLGAVRVDSVDSSRVFEHVFPARVGRNVVEAILLSTPPGDATWVLDFSEESRLVPGSLRPSVGEVVAREPRRLVFRLSGRPGVRARFTYELAR